MRNVIRAHGLVKFSPLRPIDFFFFRVLTQGYVFIDFRKREKQGGGERETLMRERNIDQLPPIHTLTEDQTHNLGMCPDRGLNPQTFGAQGDAPPS